MLLAAGISLLLVAVTLTVLQVAGVEQIDRGVFVLLVVLAALVGGWTTRLVAPRIPPLGRGRRS